MTLAEFKTVFPEFTSSSYDVRIEALIIRAGRKFNPDLDAEQLGEGVALWIAHNLQLQDIQVALGAAAAASASASTSTEKAVGRVSIKTTTSTSQSASSATGKSGGDPQYQRTIYGPQFEAWERTAGAGAVAT
jgi:hypothetical protein